MSIARPWTCLTRFAGIAALCAAAWIVPQGADAVDRRLGADVPKPTLGGVPWSAEARAGLTRDLDALLAGAATLHGAHVGLLVIDTRSGEPLYARNADDAFVPASTMKILTGSVALALLGPHYRFRTEAYLVAQNNALYIRAGGDPLLTSADIGALAHAAIATGSLHDPFAVLIDAGAFDLAPYPPGWSWDDFAYDYAPKLTPLPVDENAMQLTIAPGKRVGDAVAVSAGTTGGSDDVFDAERCAPGEIAAAGVTATTGKRGTPTTIDVVRYPPRDCFAIVGSLGLGAESETLGVAMREPTSAMYGFLHNAVAQVLHTSGAAIDPSRSVASTTAASIGFAPVPPDARLVWSHDGEPLADLLADMWWPSDNFVAEMLLRAVGFERGGMPGTTEHGAGAERTWLAGIGIDPVTLTIADGSGLSSYDRITPRALAAILQADWNGPFRDVVLDDLPVAGVRGTLAQSFVGSLAERRTFAKTGSVNHTRGLAGYLATLHHGALTFAWSVDDWMGSDADLRALRAQVLSRMIGD